MDGFGVNFPTQGVKNDAAMEVSGARRAVPMACSTPAALVQEQFEVVLWLSLS
jgi:hypothetical protein